LRRSRRFFEPIFRRRLDLAMQFLANIVWKFYAFLRPDPKGPAVKVLYFTALDVNCHAQNPTGAILIRPTPAFVVFAISGGLVISPPACDPQAHPRPSAGFPFGGP